MQTAQGCFQFPTRLPPSAALQIWFASGRVRVASGTERVYLLMGKSTTQKAYLPPLGGECPVESAANAPTDGSRCSSSASPCSAGDDDGCDFGVRSRFREAERVHLVKLIRNLCYYSRYGSCRAFSRRAHWLACLHCAPSGCKTRQPAGGAAVGVCVYRRS